MIHRAALWTAVFAILTLSACKKTPVADDVCRYDPLPAAAGVPSGQGGILARASTDNYFYALDETGKQVGSAHFNAVLPLKPGDYRVKVNASLHPASVRSGTLTTCSAGEVITNGKTDEYYYVFDGAGTQLASAHVAAALSLFPGDYQVRLNNSRSPAKVQPSATATLTPGTINVDAPTDEYYYVFDQAGTQLASAHVGRPLGVFAGAYTVKINNSESKADVRAGETTGIPAGTLLVEGSTDEYYYVFNNAGTQLASAHLSRPLALFPGPYNIKVNNSTAPATLVAGMPASIRAGSVTLQGSTDEYYYIFDHAGTQLASAHLSRPISLVPGDYIAKLNNVPLPVRAEEGKANEYPTGTVSVKSSGSDYYYVLDSAGTQLASSQVNRPVSLPAGKYSVKLGNNTRPLSVTAGQASVLQ